MTNKFTEEQYQKIVEIQKLNYKFSILEEHFGESFWRGLIKFSPDVANFSHENNLIDELAALANPLTRGWAHEKFVEKEKKYIWTSKNSDNYYRFKRLYKPDTSEMISDYSKSIKEKNKYLNEKLTESEIREWGYNPEMFDKEEVD